MTVISFVNYARLSEAELLAVLEMRNRPEIRSRMNNCEPIAPEEHLKFCANLKERKDRFYYLVRIDGVNAGSFDYIDIDPIEHTCKTGTYILDKFSRYSAAVNMLADRLLIRHGILKTYSNVLKSNEKSVLFNLIKIKGTVTGEDEQNVFFEYPSSLADPKVAERVSRLCLKYKPEILD